MTKYDFDKSVKNMLAAYPFRKIKTVMVALDWKWAISGLGMGRPTVGQMKELVKKLADSVWEDYQKETREAEYSTAAGGFHLTLNTMSDNITLGFLVEFQSYNAFSYGE